MKPAPPVMRIDSGIGATLARGRRRGRPHARGRRYFPICVSVFVPLSSLQWISARELVGNFATFDCSAAGTAQVSPATVIEAPVLALTVPRAVLSSRTGFTVRQLPPATSTAAPPLSTAPSLPFVNPPVGLNPAERFATRRAEGLCARPTARPAAEPPL